MAAHPRRRLALGAALTLAAAALTACTSTTSGSGTASGASSTPPSSRADFPSGSGSGSGGAASASSSAPSSPPASSGSGTHPVPSQPLRTVTVTGSNGTKYTVQIWADVSDPSCFDHAYGQPVITFLTQHPCKGLRRYLGTTTVNGRPVGFAQESTGFAGTATDPYIYTSQFTQLVQRDGTGSIDDLMREGYRLPSGPTSVPSPDAFNCLGQDQGVTIWDLWYLDGPTPNNDKALVDLTGALFLQY